MASFTLNFTQSVLLSSLTPSLTASNSSVNSFGTISVATNQSPVSAWITSYSFPTVNGYYSEPPIFYFLPVASLAAGTPFLITNSSTVIGSLCSNTGTGGLGTYIGTLTLGLSSSCLSGAGNGVTTVVDLSSQTQSTTYSITAINTPFAGYLNQDTYRRNFLLGLC
jgi:hypothetical protein